MMRSVQPSSCQRWTAHVKDLLLKTKWQKLNIVHKLDREQTDGASKKFYIILHKCHIIEFPI